MKVKKLWIPALILGAVGAAALICDTLFNAQGKEFFLSSFLCTAVFVGALVLLVIIGYVMSAMSRNVEIQSSKPGRNIGAGIFGFIAAVALIGSSVIGILSFGSSGSQIWEGISVLFSMLGGIMMIYEACISFTGHNGMTKRRILSLGPVVWCCVRFTLMFINYHRISFSASVNFDIFSTALLLLFLYYHAMYLSWPEKTVALRRMTLYAILYAACAAAVYGFIITNMAVLPKAVNGIDVLVIEPTISRLLTCTADIAFALYAVFFVVGAHMNTVLTDAPDAEPEDEDTKFLGSLNAVLYDEEESADEKEESDRKPVSAKRSR